MARCLLVDSGLDQKLWAEAISTAAYLRNRCPSRSLDNKTPHEVWTGRKPNVKHLKVFGSTAVALNKKRKGKFNKKGSILIMVGYSLVSKAYRLYNRDTNSVIERRDVLFDENNLPGSEEKSSSTEFITVSDIINTNNEEREDSNNIPVIRSEESTEDENIVTESTPEVEIDDACSEEFYDMDDFTGFCSPLEDIQEENELTYGPGRRKIIRTGKPGRPRKVKNLLNNVVENQLPKTYKEALSSKCCGKWQEAMEKEMLSLNEKGTWSLADLPAGHKPIKCKWVYALKKNQKGEIIRHKARLVAKGCSQKYGVDYRETFSPVVRYATIRMVLALAVEHQMHLHQLDVVTAYLNGDLHEEIYMQQPEGFKDESNPNKVLKLQKSLYGLKQAGREWNAKLNEVLCKIGFDRCKNEPCLYKMTRNNNLIIIAVYVDDIIVGCKDKNEISNIKSRIACEFEITDKGLLEHFLGMEVIRDGETGEIKLSQELYINEMLEEYGMENCKPSSVPLSPGFQMKCNGDCEKFDPTTYQSLIGALLYLALTTRPDIIHSVSKLAQRNSDPHVEHWAAAKNILRYLKGTKNLKLIFSRSTKTLEGYADADWGGCPVDRKSYSGYAFYIGKSLISWESKKQNTTALSSTEAEYISISNASKEAVYLRRLLQELGFWKDESVILNVDNQGAMKLAMNPVYHNRSKHIDIKYHHIRDVVQSKEVELKYCPTDDMIADIFTKNLPKAKHTNFVNLLNLK